jgi:hypothetical protein
VAVELRPITDADLDRVAGFLYECMDSSVPAADWRRLVEVPWEFERPNYGFMLTDGDAVVGAYLAYYSERRVADEVVRVCNLGTWCVTGSHRLHSLAMLRALLAQEGYVFTDLTPDATVISLNERLGFERLEGPAAVVPCLPWPRRPGVLISSEPAVVEGSLSGDDLVVFRDHAGCAAARQVVLGQDEERCLVVFRRESRRGAPLAILLHVSDPALYRRHVRALGGHLLAHHRVLAQVAERAVVAEAPPGSLRRSPPRRMARYPEPGERPAVDYLYSELTRITW